MTNGNFTPAAKTSFKDKIQDIPIVMVLPATTTYTAGNTDDKNKVAVLGHSVMDLPFIFLMRL